MPTVVAQTILDRAEVIIQDTTNIRWPVSELLGWLSDGQREIVSRRPDAYVQTAAQLLVAGTRQTIPAAGYQFVRATRNMGTAGTTPGRAVRKVPMDMLDSQTPLWHSATPAATTLHYVYDPREPKAFYVYPPATGTTYLEVTYSAVPADIATVGSTITLDDVYANPLLDYVLYRAYSKDATDIGNAERAVAHFQAFKDAVGEKLQADSATVQPVNTRG